MKKIKSILLIFLLLTNLIGLRAQLNTYSKVYYDSTEIGFRAQFSIPTPEDGYIIGGNYSSNAGHVLKVDSDGILLWNKQFNSSSILYPQINFNSIASSNDSCYVIAGKTFTSLGTSNALLTKINGQGDIIWTRTISKTGYSLAIYSIQQTMDSGFILTGSAEINGNNYRIFVAKTNSNGVLKWLEIFDNNNNNVGASVKQMPDSGYIVIGGVEPTKGLGSSFLLLKLFQNGTIDWSKKYNQPNCLGFDVIFTNNNLFCYFITSKIELLKTDYNGNILWSKEYGNKLSDNRNIIPRFHLLQDGSFIIPSGSFYQGSIRKIDTNGNIKFINYLQLNSFEIWETKSKNLAIIGNGPMFGLKTTGYYAPQIGLIKADSLGLAASCIASGTPTTDTTALTSNILSFTKIDGGKDTSMLLLSRNTLVLTQSRCVTRFTGIIKEDLLTTVLISPNPSSGIFKLSEANSQTYKIAIYDVYSNCIYNGIIKSNEDQIDLINNASGIYFYKLESAYGKTFTGKLVIEK